MYSDGRAKKTVKGYEIRVEWGKRLDRGGRVRGRIEHIANSIFLVTGGRKEPMAEIFAGNQLETSIAVHTNHHSPSLVLYKLIILCEINLDL